MKWIAFANINHVQIKNPTPRQRLHFCNDIAELWLLASHTICVSHFFFLRHFRFLLSDHYERTNRQSNHKGAIMTCDEKYWFLWHFIGFSATYIKTCKSFRNLLLSLVKRANRYQDEYNQNIRKKMAHTVCLSFVLFNPWAKNRPFHNYFKWSKLNLAKI